MSQTSARTHSRVTQSYALEQRVETLCEDGCRAVAGYIAALREGRDLPQFAGLNDDERLALCRELESIMAVYGGRCRV